MRISPFATPRTTPRRPLNTDLRPITRRAIAICALVPAVVAVYGILANPHVSFGFGVYVGVLNAASAMALGWLRSMAFESRHPDEPAEFWLHQEAKIRPRMFIVCAVLAALGALGLGAALAADATFIAGLLLAPTFIAASTVALMWGKVP